jgi:hypothetical protein
MDRSGGERKTKKSHTTSSEVSAGAECVRRRPGSQARRGGGVDNKNSKGREEKSSNREEEEKEKEEKGAREISARAGYIFACRPRFKCYSIAAKGRPGNLCISQCWQNISQPEVPCPKKDVMTSNGTAVRGQIGYIYKPRLLRYNFWQSIPPREAKCRAGTISARVWDSLADFELFGLNRRKLTLPSPIAMVYLVTMLRCTIYDTTLGSYPSICLGFFSAVIYNI